MASNIRSCRARGPSAGRAAFLPFLSVRRVRGAVPGDLFLGAVAHREQHRLGVVQLAAVLAVVFDDPRLDDGVDRASLLAVAAEDALDEGDRVGGELEGTVVA